MQEDDKRDDSEVVQKRRQQQAMQMGHKSKTGCPKCDADGLAVCSHSKDNKNVDGKTEGKTNEGHTRIFALNTQTPTEEKNLYKALVPLQQLKDFFDNHIKKLAEENLHFSDTDIEKFKAEKGYSAEIKGNLLIIRSNDEKLLNDMTIRAYKNGMILGMSPEQNQQLQKEAADNTNNGYKTPTPFGNLLNPKLKPV